MKIENLIYDTNYNSGLGASVDWIAGGNFDGYIFRNTLRFSEVNNTVSRIVTIIDKSRYDSEVNSTEASGVFFETDKKAITCDFGQYKMHGKILGKNNEFIAFSVHFKNSHYNYTECYELTF